MNKHRSLADALTTDPKKLEFIHGGKRRPELPSPNPAKAAASAAPQEQPEPATEPEFRSEPPPEQQPSPKVVAKEERRDPRQDETPEEESSEEPRRPASRRNREKGRGTAPEVKPTPVSLTQAVVPFTTRFRQSTAEALRRASLERKLAGETPNSQQEIVEHCVSAWLKSHGYLDG